jgi:putative addiction module killer protein
LNVIETDAFAKWFSELRDSKARTRIQARIDRLIVGNPGDVKPIGSGLSEMRIDYGPGYRVYFLRKGVSVIILLAGGDKRSQKQDIRCAQELAGQL